MEEYRKAFGDIRKRRKRNQERYQVSNQKKRGMLFLEYLNWKIKDPQKLRSSFNTNAHRILHSTTKLQRQL